MKHISSILLNLFVVFAFAQSPLYAGLDRAEEEQHASLKRQRSSDACVKEPPTKKARQLTPKAQEAQDKLEVFEKQLATLTQTQDAAGLQTNAFLTGWRFDDDQTPWEALVEECQIPRWHVAEGVPQKASFAVLSHALWNAAFTEPYQKMVLHTLYPLYEFATEQRELGNAIDESFERLKSSIQRHGYLNRRFAVYAMLEGTRLHNPLAGFVFFTYLISSDMYCVAESMADQRPFKAFGTLLKVMRSALQHSKTQIKVLCQWDALSPYADCPFEEALKQNTLEQKIEKGLFGFARMKAGNILRTLSRSYGLPLRQYLKSLKEAERLYSCAANAFDPTACFGMSEVCYRFQGLKYSRKPGYAAAAPLTNEEYTQKAKIWVEKACQYKTQENSVTAVQMFEKRLRQAGLPH